MFLNLFLALRDSGVNVSLQEFLVFLQAVKVGLVDANVDGLYTVARALLVKRESDYDRFDAAFAEVFHGIESHFRISDALEDWLNDPRMPAFSPEDIAALEALDLEELAKLFEERLREQKERHDGGNHWIGTGGTSPFGNSGAHPSGMRVGGQGGGRSAMQVATARRFRHLRHDVVLDTRHFAVALKRLRRLNDRRGREELSVEKTIDKTARDAGELNLVFEREKANKLRLMLLVDTGGSMDPHAEISEQLFSAAHASKSFKNFEMYAFHNCVYERLYKNIATGDARMTEDVLAGMDDSWVTIIVGDAWMHPFELSQVGGAIYYGHHNQRTGMEWLQLIRRKCPQSVWLNPEPPRIWEATSARLIRTIFPMFSLSVDGLTEAIDTLRGVRPNRPDLESAYPSEYA